MDLLAPLRKVPKETALLFDVDGTLAPIAPLPELARVPPETRAELARLARSYLLVACISGRAGDEAEALVGVEGIRYVGNHGLELDERAAALAGLIAAFRDSVALPVEDKGLSLSYHYRGAEDEQAARAELEEVAERARAEGLDPRWGRKVLEIRPPVEADKGTAVQALLASVPARCGLYAGTTRPTSMPSPASRRQGSSTSFESPSNRRKGRAISSSPPTSPCPALTS